MTILAHILITTIIVVGFLAGLVVVLTAIWIAIMTAIHAIGLTTNKADIVWNGYRYCKTDDRTGLNAAIKEGHKGWALYLDTINLKAGLKKVDVAKTVWTAFAILITVIVFTLPI